MHYIIIKDKQMGGIGINSLKVKKLYADKVFAMDPLDGFVSMDTLNRRKYIQYVNIVKECSENRNKLNLKQNEEMFRELANCQQCQCFNCQKVQRLIF